MCKNSQDGDVIVTEANQFLQIQPPPATIHG